jgi:ketosteroid isomerase-like protein
MLSSSAALVVGNYQLEREADHPSGVFTLIFRKFREGWRIINDHTSAAPKQ